MSSIIERYAGAISSKNLKSDPRTNASDSDVLGAAGLAAKYNPLAIALERLFYGDEHAAALAAVDIVALLSDEVWHEARKERQKLRRVQADSLARAVLAWYRNGTCKPCGGHGYAIIGTLGTGRAVVSDQECPSCKGTKKVLFEPAFTARELPYAYWLRDRIEAQSCIAGPAMMRRLAKGMEL